MYFLLIIIDYNNNLKAILKIILLFNIYLLPWIIIIIELYYLFAPKENTIYINIFTCIL